MSLLKKKKIKENDLKEIIKKNENINTPLFLKIDIEGSEYRVLPDIINYKNQIEAIIIEFHDVDLHLEKIVKFVKDLDFKITHIHGNNYERTVNNLPLVMEVTLEKNPDFKDEFSDLPHKDDAPCNPKNQEIRLIFD